MRVLLLSRYDTLPGPSRYRFFQYIPCLKQFGIEVTVSPLLHDGYVRYQYETRRFALSPLPAIYARRLRALAAGPRFDLVWVEKECFPWLPAWLERFPGLRRVPYVLDYDDAIFHTYDQDRRWLVRRLLGGKIAALMRGAALVMAGNDYLRDYALRAGARRVEWVPSVVDLARYPARSGTDNRKFTVGWWGSPPNSRHLQLVAGPLAEVCRAGGGVLRVLGGWKQELPGEIQVEYGPFSAADEVEPSLSFDVGIMPLPDGPWERGKCGLKLIHYMACGLPTVASPVGINSQIVEHGVTGFLASTDREWVEALRALRGSAELRRTMGQAGRNKVERLYSLQANGPRVARMLLECASPARNGSGS